MRQLSLKGKPWLIFDDFFTSPSQESLKLFKKQGLSVFGAEVGFFRRRRMLRRQKFIKSKGRAILGEEDIFSQRQRMLIEKYKRIELC